ncbi:MAG TPA: NAD-binding protein [Actinomycetota bacterium]|nr:NAD-binding protein [Actinomycetota bacterium]
MSVVVLGASGELGAAVVNRLLEAGDDVGVIEPSPERAEGWRRAGAHVARGSSSDADLIERASQNARTIVVLDADQEVLSAAVEGARLAEVERIVATGARTTPELIALLRSSGLDYVVLETGRRLLGAATPADVGRAVDAADDLPGRPRLELSLRTTEAWRELRLEPPRRRSRR